MIVKMIETSLEISKVYGREVWNTSDIGSRYSNSHKSKKSGRKKKEEDARVTISEFE